ncbi:MAG: TetR/AcrR family transcriptional regulator [Betaproteobacteria bacterium]|nr:TetR/AcrR family transcriptional regulator [Betaproteobacteria bacterium]
MATSAVAGQDHADRTNTRRNIKVAARRLFAERGLEAVTVREIVAAAGARNGGSLNYYFKSKEGLILELINDIFNDLSRVWLDNLSELNKNGGARSARDIVDIIVRGHNTEDISDPAPTMNRFIATVLFNRRKALSDYLDQMNMQVYKHLLEKIVELYPNLPAQVMRQRLVFFSWYVVAVQAAYETWRASRKRGDLWTQPDPLVHLVDTATALLETGLPEMTVSSDFGRPG